MPLLFSAIRCLGFVVVVMAAASPSEKPPLATLERAPTAIDEEAPEEVADAGPASSNDRETWHKAAQEKPGAKGAKGRKMANDGPLVNSQLIDVGEDTKTATAPLHDTVNGKRLKPAAPPPKPPPTHSIDPLNIAFVIARMSQQRT